MKKKPEARCDHNVGMILPLFRNLPIFKETNVRDDYNVSRTCEPRDNLLIPSPEDLKFMVRNVKFGHYSQGERITEYKSNGCDFFMIIKGKA